MNGASQTGILIALGVVAAVGTFGAVMSPENTTAIIGFSTLIATSLLGLLAQVHSKQVLEQKLNKVDRTSDATHALVNSQTSAQLRSNAVMARRIAELTGEQADHALATAAEMDYHEHEKRQAMVDKGFGVATQAAPPMAPSTANPLPPAPLPVPKSESASTKKDITTILDAIKDIPEVEVVNLPHVQKVEIVDPDESK